LKVKLAKTAGFCMGVRRAIEMVLTETNKSENPIYTYGPIIHNNQVLDLLASKGVHSIEDLEGLKAGTIVIRAHGIPPKLRQYLKNSGLKLIDATCPRVIRVQTIIRSYTRKGYDVVILGDSDHPEVIGLMGYSEKPAYLIQALEDVAALPQLERLFVVAQTTQDEQVFDEITAAIKKRFPNTVIFNTICEATHQRQQEIRNMAEQVDSMVIVGGYHSGNTQRLVQVADKAGLTTFHVETEHDLDKERLAQMEIIGVTAGASTPNWMIKNVMQEIEGIRGRRDPFLFLFFKRVVKILVLSNLAAATGAFSFAYSISTVSRVGQGDLFPILAFLYIYAMHVFNKSLDKMASVYNDPERAAFLKKHWRFLNLLGVIAIAVGMIVAYFISFTTMIALFALSLLGIFYSIPIIPVKKRWKYRYVKIKDVPGSRSLSEALAWVSVISLLPLLNTQDIIWPVALTSIIVTFLISYVRTALFDIFQVQGDLIVGIETLPITLGEKRTIILLKSVLLILGMILILTSFFDVFGTSSYILLIPVMGLAACLMAYEKRWFIPDINFEAIVEGNFILAGLVAFFLIT